MKINNFLIIKYIVYDLVFRIHSIQKIHDRNKYDIITFKHDLLNEQYNDGMTPWTPTLLVEDYKNSYVRLIYRDQG